ncbi:DUF502 domain-containing protein [Lewinella sp. LCG006]|uniref:DUF502 domain-containing protein n=1 Tax=Lewinella sp. LCG006 TaxID=3231911 RepID=UPI0034615B25
MKGLVVTENKVPPFTWKNYLLNAIVGGLIVILPLGILFLVFQFILGIAATLLQPLTALMGFSADDRGIRVGIISSIILLALLFIIGISVSSEKGKRNFLLVEHLFFHKIPFYGTLRDTIKAFVEREKTPFSDVVLIDCYGTGALMTGLVTDEHPSGLITVFVPTAPNPANGCVYHVPKHLVTYLDCTIEQAMHTVVTVGVGSSDLYNLRRPAEGEKLVIVEEEI